MTNRKRSEFLRTLGRLFSDGTIATSDDEHLLQRFVSHREEAAFEALLHSHGPMVLGLCRRILANPHDADDAFQATFLVLAQKAGTIRNRMVLASWLHGVAYKVAARTRTVARRERMQLGGELGAVPAADTPDELERRELRAILDEEIDRLPDRYRALVVLHYLEGRTHEQIARQLVCPIGTVHSRLTRARDRLRARLVRRGLNAGLTPVASLATAADDPASLPPALVSPTAAAAVDFSAGRAIEDVVAAPVAILVKQTLRTLSMRMLRSTVCATLALGLMMTGAGVLAFQGAAPPLAGDRPAATTTTALERMAGDQVPSYELRMAGAGDPREAPEGLVAVLGDSRLKHWSFVGDVAFSPDGALIASSSGDGTARIWDAVNGDERLRLHARPMWQGGGNQLASIAFSPDGRTLAAGGSNSAVMLWDVATGRELNILKADRPVYSLAFHPDGRRLATGQELDAALWDVGTGERIRTFAGHASDFRRRYATEHVTVAFASGAQTLVVGHPDGKVRSWDISTGRLLRTLEAHDAVMEVSVSPGGELLATGGSDGENSNIKVWDAAGGTLRRTIEGAHKQDIQGLVFRPDGILASGGLDGQVRYWDPATGANLKSFQASQGVGVESLAFNKDGTVLASAGLAVRAWDAETGRRLLEKPGHEGQAKSVVFADGGRLLATCGGDGLLKVWDLATRGEGRSIEASGGIGSSVASSPDGATLATIDMAGRSVRLWETATGRPRATWPIEGEEGLGQTVRFSPDGRWLLATTMDRRAGMHVIVRDLETGKVRGELETAQGTALFSRDGERLIVAGQAYVGPGFQANLSEWTLADMKRVARLDNFEGMSQLWCAALSGDGKTLALAGGLHGPDDAAHRVVILWDLERRRRRLVLEHGDDMINGLDFAPDGSSLASISSRAGKLRVWDPRDGSLRQTVEYPDAGYWRIQAVAFAPDSRHLATAMGNGTTYILRIRPPREGVEEVAIVAPGPPTPQTPRTDLWADLIGKPAPELRQVKGWLLGEPTAMAELRGRPVLLHFWNVGSDSRMPALMRLHRQYAEKGLVVIVVWRDFPGSTAQGAMKALDEFSRDQWQDRKLPFRVALDGGGETPIDGTSLKVPGATRAAYRVLQGRRGWVVPPVEFLIGPEGRILTAMAAGSGRMKLANELERLLGKGAPDRSTRELSRVYALANDQVLRRIGEPYPPVRAEYFLDRYDSRSVDWSHLFRYDGTLSLQSSSSRAGFDLRGALSFVIGLKSYEVAGPDDLLAAKVPPGDWVYRAGTPRGRLLDALGAVLRRDAELPVKFELREVEREVIVASGKYQFHPVADGDEARFVHLFVGTSVPQSRSFAGGGSGTLREMLDWVGNRIDLPIVHEAGTPIDLTLSWRDHVRESIRPADRSKAGGKDAATGQVDRDPTDRLLGNLSKQTSLRFRREPRKVGVWFVLRDGT